jgi:CheY-like chemotaxis protein
VRAAQSKKVQIEVEAMPEPLWVELDPAQLSQVLLNLLTNAAEAIGDAPGRVMVRAWAGLAPVEVADGAPAAPWALVSVEDTGPGIPEAMQARIFDPFFSTKASGRGLGLSAVRGIVQSLGGTLQLTSPAGGGARFLIGLPAATSPEAVRTEASPVPSPAHGTVLVIDDEPSMRLVARRVIERSGLQVLEARDGAEGVAVFDAHVDELSLILLDLTMPKLNGAEVLAHIRRVRATLPVIVASGYDASDATNEWPADPHTQFLQKPFGVQALRDLLLETLGPVASGVSAR